jgi:hypothetical protein
MTMAINAANGNSTYDPGTLNSQLTNNPGKYTPFDTNGCTKSKNCGNLIWGQAPASVSNGGLKFLGRRIDSLSDSSGANTFLDNALCNAHEPAIVGVTGSKGSFPGHYVLVYGKQGSTYSVIDPGSVVDNQTTLDTFGHFETRGYVADPTGDLSRLELVVDDSADLLVADPTGTQTGLVNVATGQDVQNIPQSYHFVDSLDDDAPSAGVPIGPTHTVGILQPPQGTYQINIVGLKLGTYGLLIASTAQDGSALSAVVIDGVTSSGSTSTFTLHFSSLPGTSVSVSRVATFTTTLADITNSLSLSLIDNAGIANALSSQIQAAQAASSRGDRQTAINVLNAFQNLVSAQAGKHITGVTPQVLLEDAGSLIGQSQ